MRKKYNHQNNNAINNYFSQLIMVRYIIPSLILLLVVFVSIFFGISYVPHLFTDYTIANFLYFLSMNILISIASISIYHTIKTCVFGYNQLAERKYTVLQLNCVAKYKDGLVYKCILEDDKIYKLYDQQQYQNIKEGQPCDLIIITNEYGAKMWEIVIGTPFA